MNIEPLIKQAQHLKLQGRYTEAGDLYMELAQQLIAANDATAAHFFNLAAYAYSYDTLTTDSVFMKHSVGFARMKHAYDAAIAVYRSIENHVAAGKQSALAADAFYAAQHLHEAIEYYTAASAFYHSCGLLLLSDKYAYTAQCLINYI